jgi:hypothetical protein
MVTFKEYINEADDFKELKKLVDSVEKSQGKDLKQDEWACYGKDGGSFTICSNDKEAYIEENELDELESIDGKNFKDLKTLIAAIVKLLK